MADRLEFAMSERTGCCGNTPEVVAHMALSRTLMKAFVPLKVWKWFSLQQSAEWDHSLAKNDPRAKSGIAVCSVRAGAYPRGLWCWEGWQPGHKEGQGQQVFSHFSQSSFLCSGVWVCECVCMCARECPWAHMGAQCIVCAWHCAHACMHVWGHMCECAIVCVRACLWVYTGVQWVHECEWVACVCARTMYVSECVSVYASMHACVCTFVQQIFIGDTCAGLWGAI